MKIRKLTSKMIGVDWYEAICPKCDEHCASVRDGSEHIESNIDCQCTLCDTVYKFPINKRLSLNFKVIK